VDIVTVKKLLGHANISTTMRYAHSNDDAKRRAVNRLRSDKIVTRPPQRAKKAV
jgi:site-specific recombinase XerD